MLGLFITACTSMDAVNSETIRKEIRATCLLLLISFNFLIVHFGTIQTHCMIKAEKLHGKGITLLELRGICQSLAKGQITLHIL